MSGERSERRANEEESQRVLLVELNGMLESRLNEMRERNEETEKMNSEGEGIMREREREQGELDQLTQANVWRLRQENARVKEENKLHLLEEA